jgi:predicted nicotinamide N-methyase
MGDTDVQDDVEFDLEDFQVGPYNFTVTTIAFMPLEVLMAMGDKKVEISGQKLWCGSLGVIEYLLGNPEFVQDKRVLELGAGTGVLGMLCSKLGSTNVVLTDNDIRSLNHMNEDVPRNKILNTTVSSLDWFNPPSSAELIDMMGFQTNSVVAAADDDDDACDYSNVRIVAGDVLYKQVLLEPFITTCKNVLTTFPGSKMILCHVPRVGIDQIDVINLAKNKKLNIVEIDETQWLKGSVIEYSVVEDHSRAKMYQITL